MHRRTPSPRRTRTGVDSRTLCSVSSNAFPYCRISCNFCCTELWMRSGIYTESDVPRILKRFTTYCIIIHLHHSFKCHNKFYSTFYLCFSPFNYFLEILIIRKIAGKQTRGKKRIFLKCVSPSPFFTLTFRRSNLT